MTDLRAGEGRAPTELNWDEHWLPVGQGDLKVLLRHRVPSPASPERMVLFVPGANSSADTFTIPHGGLVAHLAARGCDIWMLDWRASPLVLKGVLCKPPASLEAVEAERAAFTLDRMVREDIPAALEFIRNRNARAALAVHAHCVGGGGVAMAIARGLLEPFNVDRVVLSTLGLFYEVPWNTWIKAEDFLLESILLPREKPDCRDIDPRRPEVWPKVYHDAYSHWPRAWLPGGTTASDDFLRNLSFMVGQPYSRNKLDPSIDGEPVESIFGPLHLGLYTHLGQMVRRGYSAAFNVRDQIDRIRLRDGIRSAAPTPPAKADRERADREHAHERSRMPARSAPQGDLVRARFEPYHLTLVAAGDNGVWHRDSIDLMFEWLRRSPKIRCDKHVIQDYNIQELYWAADAPRRAYGTFAAGVGL